jgi:glucose-6-phosphate isomerase
MERWTDPNWVSGMALRLDFSNMMSEFLGEARGISRSEVEALQPKARTVAAAIEEGKKSGTLGFYELPYDLATASQVLKTAQQLREDTDDLVVLGIGGSALGGAALVQALTYPLHNYVDRMHRNRTPRVSFMDNVDPATFKAVLDNVNIRRTVFNVITKSGSTTETVSQFLIVHKMLSERLGREAKDHIIVTTGPEKKALRAFSEEQGFRLFTIPDNVGGRYSVLSPVGLFPAAMVGIDIAELMAGARHMDEHCVASDLWRNPAYLSGALHYLADTRKNLKIAVIMPYSDALGKVGYWFRQLWAESLGKARSISGELVNVGQTPVAAFGVTDQHSQLQLYQDGPFDKMIMFLLVERHIPTVKVPTLESVPEFAHLAGHDLGQLLNIEADATSFALTRAGRANLSIILPEVNAFTLGQLLFMFEVQTVFAGGLYNIDPLDQPGVESSKDYIYGLTGRHGYEEKASEIAEWRGRPGRYTI